MFAADLIAEFPAMRPNARAEKPPESNTAGIGRYVRRAVDVVAR
jgi:hypothetical protein